MCPVDKNEQLNLLAGKTALITGVISDKSIAYGIAKSMHKLGANLIFTCQTEKVLDRVVKIAKDFSSDPIVIPCDVSSDSDLELLSERLKSVTEVIDIAVHSIAYAPSDQLTGNYAEQVNREGFRIAHDVSSYSLCALAKITVPFMKNGGSFLTLTYLGSSFAIPNYNVMGLAKASLEANVRYLAYSLGHLNIRVNAISAGPIKTIAASGVRDLRKILSYNEKASPLKRNVTIQEVGNVGALLCSDMFSAVTGEVVHVDCGYHVVGCMLPEGD